MRSSGDRFTLHRLSRESHRRLTKSNHVHLRIFAGAETLVPRLESPKGESRRIRTLGRG